MDAWIAHHQQRAYDDAGRWARSGQSNQALLASMLADDYFAQRPPKSTGKEYFNLPWLQRALERHSALNAVDVQASLLDLTATSIADAVAQAAPTNTQLLVCGGGRLNGALLDRLRDLLPQNHIQPSEAVGIDGDSLEAAAFAWLACRTLAGLHGNVPAVTGATNDVVLGGIYPAGSAGN